MATRTNRTKSAPAEEPAGDEITQDMEASPRYILFAEWLKEERGLDCDPLTLEIAQKNYGAFQRSDVNRANNVRLAEERAAAIQAREEEREQKAKEREEKRAAAEKAREEKAAAAKAREAGAPTAGKATTAVKSAATKKAAPAAKSTGKPRAARGKSSTSPF
jgi:hypothetical protein